MVIWCIVQHDWSQFLLYNHKTQVSDTTKQFNTVEIINFVKKEHFNFLHDCKDNLIVNNFSLEDGRLSVNYIIRCNHLISSLRCTSKTMSSS